MDIAYWQLSLYFSTYTRKLGIKGPCNLEEPFDLNEKSRFTVRFRNSPKASCTEVPCLGKISYQLLQELQLFLRKFCDLMSSQFFVATDVTQSIVFSTDVWSELLFNHKFSWEIGNSVLNFHCWILFLFLFIAAERDTWLIAK